jgi:membrane protease YdiL (CAAX protease family)
MEGAPQATPVALPPKPARLSAGPTDVLSAVLVIVGLNVVAMLPFIVTGGMDGGPPDFGLLWLPVDVVITLTVAWVFGCHRYGRSLRDGWSYLPVPARLIGLGALLGLACAAIAMLVPDAGAQPPMLRMTNALRQRPAGGLLIVGVVALAAVMEETYYRGFIYTALSESWGRTRAIVVVSLWFTLLHIPQLAGDWRAIATISVLGIIVTVLRAYSGSTVPALVTHLVYNLTLTGPTTISWLLRKS